MLWALSGFSILTLETLWMREIALRAGNTAVASTLVIVVFFVFAALGNAFGARLVDGRGKPLVMYGRFEVLGAVTAWLLFELNRWSFANVGQLSGLWAGPLVATILLAGPPSFLSGVAFPSLAETFVNSPDQRTSRGGIFYGVNLIGAALGVVAGGVLLPWWLGMKSALVVAVMTQLVGGLLALRVARRSLVVRRVEGARETKDTGFPAWLGWSLLVASGVLSLAAQTLLIVWARQVMEGSIYAVASVLTVFISGLGLGALVAGRLSARGFGAEVLLRGFAGVGAVLLMLVPMFGQWLCASDWPLTAHEPAAMMGQALLRTGLLLPLTICLGGVFPVAWELVKSNARGEGRFMGNAIALNKLGAAAGSALALFASLPMLGLARGTMVIAWCYLLIAWLPALVTRSLTALGGGLLAGACVLGLWQSLQPTPVLGVDAEYRSIASYSGAYGPVEVVENVTSGSRQILLNTRQRLSGTRSALASQQHQSWVPLLFSRHPDRVMSIGMAAGLSSAAALDFPVKELRSVELVAEVVRAAHDHFSEWNAALFNDPRSHVEIGDGRLQLAQSSGDLDAIICDLLFPAEEGSALLYSREFFQLAASRLNTDGVFCLWLPCYQHTAETAGIIIRTFADVFPNAIMVRANMDPLAPVVGLIGGAKRLPLSDEYLKSRLETPWAKAIAQRSPFFASPDSARLLMVCDLHSANPSFASHPLTTDDLPLLAWLGPREPQGKERLRGFPFLDWIGRRAMQPTYPSCELGSTSPNQVQSAIRAGNFYFAAAAAQTSLPGDPRPEEVRLHQVESHLSKARSLLPTVSFPVDKLGE